MPEISAIRALRYNLGHVGNLSDVVAPPADAISPAMQDQLYKRHPAGCVRLIANRAEPGDGADSRDERAARFWRRWQNEGVLQDEAAPEVYIYQHTYLDQGQSVTRRGILCGVRFDSPEDRRLYTALETTDAVVEARFELMRRCAANLTPIVGLCSDPEDRLLQLVEGAIQEGLEITCVDDVGVRHSIWPVSDDRTIGSIQELVGPAPMLVAAGEDPLLASRKYRMWLNDYEGPLASDHPANFVLTLLLRMEDSEDLLASTHPVFRGPTPLTSEDLVARIGECFTCNTIVEGPDSAEVAWKPIAASDHQGRLAIYCGGDRRWVLCEIKEPGIDRLRELCPQASDEWCELSINQLHHLVVADLLQIADATVEPCRTIDDVVATIGEDQGCCIAALVPPIEVDAMETIAVQEERLPANTFHMTHEPLSGLIFNPLQRR
ncbi:hypothetical protein Poly24_35020 [Rosistilla carotiformis]|uniref:DUF1015 domain-containing protein n=1 Tax=Rosistilla carotiformis TaxID=2528017 RepID=A0A518JW66_9BACT|nr:DUF1015 domain-containing protein [Rosistilla carotiformis]QDV69785.1 hypothetical protein Poly24_35020 [Rosistilla carotiformis]